VDEPLLFITTLMVPVMPCSVLPFRYLLHFDNRSLFVLP
jgi:hypothetical protein